MTYLHQNFDEQTIPDPPTGWIQNGGFAVFRVDGVPNPPSPPNLLFAESGYAAAAYFQRPFSSGTAEKVEFFMTVYNYSFSTLRYYLWACANSLDPDVAANRQFGVMIRKDAAYPGQFAVYYLTTAGGYTLITRYPEDTFIKITMVPNFTTRTWNLLINDVPILTDYAMPAASAGSACVGMLGMNCNTTLATKYAMHLLLDNLTVGSEPTPGWTGKVGAVTNPAKINGIPVANIKKVSGVPSGV